MDKTTKFELPYILAAQAQKHVTHNEALRRLDALIHISIISSLISIPPDSPFDGDCYLVAADGQGDWLGEDGNLACYQDGNWQFISPRAGMLAWLQSEGQLLAHDGVGFTSVLEDIQAPSIDDLALLGVNATADETNRLVVSSAASLFSHEGNGHQLKVNKAGSGDTASLLFQTGFSGRAEMGLAGNDGFSVKVSPDGAAWYEAITVNPATGAVSFPNTTLPGGGTGSPGGANTQVQYNDNGAFAGSADFTFDAAAKRMFVNGKISLPATSLAGEGVVEVGGERLLSFYGTDNTFLGRSSGNLSVTGTRNMCLGPLAGASLTSGDGNLLMGYASGITMASGLSNTAIGYQTLYSCSTGSYNVAIGSNALVNSSTGDGNTCIGRSSGALVTASYNTSMGHYSLASATSGARNTAIGESAGYTLTTGSDNLCLGHNSGMGITEGSYNVIIGGVTGLPAALANTIIIGDGAGNERLRMDANRADFKTPPRFPNHAVAEATQAFAASAGAGAMIFVADETGGAVMAFSDGTDWRRVTDRAIVS